MTTFERPKPTLVLMAGYGGSGKTTLAYALGAKLGWPIMDKDIFKAEIVLLRSKLSIKEINTLTYNVLFRQTRDVLVHQRLSMILDTSAAFPEMMARVDALVEESEACLKIILCKASHPLRRDRLRKRNELDAGRRQLIIDISDLHKDDWQRFDHLPLEHLIELDTSRPFDEYFEKALLHLL